MLLKAKRKILKFSVFGLLLASLVLTLYYIRIKRIQKINETNVTAEDAKKLIENVK